MSTVFVTTHPTEQSLLEHCAVAGRRSHSAGVLRADDPFMRLIRRGIVINVPAAVWERRSQAWLAGWDSANAASGESTEGPSASRKTDSATFADSSTQPVTGRNGPSQLGT